MRAASRLIAVSMLVGFMSAGAAGLFEAVLQWANQGTLPGPFPNSLPYVRPVRMLAPHVIFYGAGGALLALLVLLPAGVATRRARSPGVAAATLAASGAGAALVVLQIGHLLRDHWLVEWWAARGLREGRVVVIVLWLLLLAAGWRVWRPVVAWFHGGSAWRAVLAFAAVGALCMLWPSADLEGRVRRTAGLGERATPPAGAPNLILITVDTWRRDHLTAIAPDSPPTPALDALAAESVLFTNAWAPSPWTLPSLAALQTGLAPRVLRVVKLQPLPASPERLAQIAWRSGWDSAAFLTNPYLLDHYLLDRGFAVYHHANSLPALLPVARSLLAVEISRAFSVRKQVDRAEDVLPQAVSWLAREAGRGPFYFWLHLVDPHLPYAWRELPGGPPPDGLGSAPRREEIPVGHRHFPQGEFSAVGHVREGTFVPDAAERRAIAALYAREVQYTDAWLGLLFEELRRLDLWDSSLIVVTSDHGEELFDHGGFEHGHSLMPEVTGVPLIVRMPGGAAGGRRCQLPVSLLDLVPTLCAIFGWPVPPEREGVDLSPVLRGEQELPAAVERVQVLENMLYGPEQQGWLVWPWLRVGAPDSGGVWFDLSGDPEARIALPAPPGSAELTGRVRRQVAVWDRQAATIAADFAVETPELPPEIKRRLEALGY